MQGRTPTNQPDQPTIPPTTVTQADAEKRFMEVKTAFSVLSDPQQRSQYDSRQRSGVSGAAFRWRWWGVEGAGAVEEWSEPF